MHFEKPGPVTDRILMLGRSESCIYLIDGGSECAIIGGGTIHIAPELIQQLADFNIDEKKIRRIIILHSHFDHCGIVPFLKRRWPELEIAASARARELLSAANVIETIVSLNQAVLQKYQRHKEADQLDLSFEGIEVDLILRDGDRIACGDLTLEVLEVPGHSSCSIAVFCPEAKALFSSDAAGIPLGDAVFTAANSNFDQYQASLARMAEMDVAVVLAEHYGGRSGRDAKLFFKKSIESAHRMRAMLQASFQRTQDIEKSTQAALDQLLPNVPADFLPKEVIYLVISQTMRFFQKKAMR